ncbi:hypothetical protein SAMN05216219_1119 [Mycetocola miduiensis]|uniref:2-oxoacid dehydrogenase acyltransferase catalytic domain-containing protein n=1 Tax=Mycetocola miduiensis TaxID=995034 RepID=A0A1I4ZWB2_9MICO|nr:hypothetical protein SAMN05216219_1119 [Mycetocola miduiensis]
MSVSDNFSDGDAAGLERTRGDRYEGRPAVPSCHSVCNSCCTRCRLPPGTPMDYGRRSIHEHRSDTGESISLTAYVAAFLARAVRQHSVLNSIRRGHRLIRFEDVNVISAALESAGANRTQVDLQVVAALKRTALRKRPQCAGGLVTIEREALPSNKSHKPCPGDSSGFRRNSRCCPQQASRMFYERQG